MEQIIIQQKIHEFRGQRAILDYDLHRTGCSNAFKRPAQRAGDRNKHPDHPGIYPDPPKCATFY